MDARRLGTLLGVAAVSVGAPMVALAAAPTPSVT
jgi:hypothetical protein